MRKVRAGSISEISPEKPLIYRERCCEVVVFETSEGYFAVENRCPHVGARLHQGIVEGNDLTCIWHGWKFDLKSGQCYNEYWASLKKYPIEIDGDNLYIWLDEKE
ncbi:MAG: hypothetical protein Kow0037_17390 [Calditrichia bacterium]